MDAITTVKRFRSTGGFTLVEAMVTTLILSVAVIGASGYRYHSALDARKGAMQITAARAAMLLCESWRGVSGSLTYSPTAYFGSELPITDASLSDPMLEYHLSEAVLNPLSAEGFTQTGIYTVTLNGTDYTAVLAYKDIGSGLRALNVVIVQPQATGNDSQFKVYKLTTYTTY